MGVVDIFPPHKGGLRVGEKQVEILEQTVKHQSEDIRDIRQEQKDMKKEIDELRMKHTVTDSNVNQFAVMFSKLEEKIMSLETKFQTQRDEQLKHYNGAMIKLFFGLVAAVLLIQLGLK